MQLLVVNMNLSLSIVGGVRNHDVHTLRFGYIGRVSNISGQNPQ